MWRSNRPSLPQALAYAVAKAVGTTLVLLGVYVGGSVVTDMSQLAEGRRTPPAQDVVVQTDELPENPVRSSPSP